MATVQNPDAGENENIIVKLDDADLAPPPDDDAIGGSGAAADGVAPPSSATTPPVTTPVAGLEDLRGQLETSQRQRKEQGERAAKAEHERNQAIAAVQEAQSRGVSLQELQNETEMVRIQEQMDALERESVSLMDDGKFADAAQINRKMAKLGGELSYAEQRKTWLVQERERAQLQAQQAAAMAAQDPVETFISTRDPRLRDFLQTHRNLMRADGTVRKVALDAHESAMESGEGLYTPGYFAHIEKFVTDGGTKRTNGEQEPAVTTRQEQRRPMPAPSVAAPVSRGAVGGSTGIQTDGTFVVTPRMRKVAAEQEIPITEWVQGYIKSVRDGRMEEWKE